MTTLRTEGVLKKRQIQIHEANNKKKKQIVKESPREFIKGR